MTQCGNLAAQNMPSYNILSFNALVAVDNKLIFSFGGKFSGPSGGTVYGTKHSYKHDLAQNQWTQLTAMNLARTNAAAILMRENEILISGEYLDMQWEWRPI